MSTSLLDLAGVLALGMVGVMASAYVQDTPPPAFVERVILMLGLADVPLSTASLIIAGLAALLLVLKTVITLYVLRRVTKFLARCSAEVAARLSEGFFGLPLVRIQEFTSQWSAYALLHGVTGAIVYTLSNAMVVWVEMTLLGVLTLALLFLDPLITCFTAGYFLLVGVGLNRSLKSWAVRSGKIIAEADVASFATVYDGIATYREVTVVNRRSFYVERYRNLRYRGSSAFADQQYILQLPRYAMEAALVAGCAILVVGLLLTGSADSAVGSLVLFLAAATRVMPSILRLNSARITLRSMAPVSDYAFTMQEHISRYGKPTEAPSAADVREPVIGPSEEARGGLAIEVRDLTVRYPGSDVPALDGVSFAVPQGGSLAIVGPSGGGKSTLADALLGVLEPSRGSVAVGGLPPHQLVRELPGAVAYVPQAVALVTGSVRDNVALGLRPEEVDDERVLIALQRAHLAEYLLGAREGLDTPVGERGVQLSGGQRQRLGIARALYLDPRLIVMDEATSALDAETESLITETVESLGPDVTKVTIAHRLATIRRADTVIYLDRGMLMSQGSFIEVRTAVPEFDHQANLLGL